MSKLRAAYKVNPNGKKQIAVSLSGEIMWPLVMLFIQPTEADVLNKSEPIALLVKPLSTIQDMIYVEG